MKKYLVFVCVLIMALGVIGCKENKPGANSTSSLVTSATASTTDAVDTSIISEEDDGSGSNAISVPEPATMLLLGSGLVGFAWVRRKKYSKTK